MWFTELNSPNIGRITPNGKITEFPIRRAAYGIAAGSDGNLWFTSNNSIGRMTPSGTVTTFNLPVGNALSITTGSDGNLWFTAGTSDPFASELGRVTMGGQIEEFPLPLPGAYTNADAITTGPEGKLWIATDIAIVRFDPVTRAVDAFRAPSVSDGSIPGITVGADGNLWFTENFPNKIGRITPFGLITEYPIPTQQSYPAGITSGPDGKIWFVESVAAQAGRLVPPPVRSGDEAYIEHIYQDLLHRDVDASGLGYFTGLLDQGVSRFQIVLDIEQSLEYRTEEVKGLYSSLLGRSADPAGLDSFVAYLGAGHSVTDVKILILGSPEYFARAGATNEAFLVALYRDILGRAVDPIGELGYSAIMERGFGLEVVAFFDVRSLEARQDIVDGFYHEFLDRATDPSGLAAFMQPRPGGFPDELILATILGSEEYFDRFGSLWS